MMSILQKTAVVFLGLFWVCSTIAFAGQSITLSTANASNPLVAAQAPDGPCRVEMSFHDWDSNPPPNSHPWDAPACGFNFTIYNLGTGVVYLQIFSLLGGQGCIVHLGVDAHGQPTLPSKFATVRFQRVPNSSRLNGNGAGFTELCEATDINGRTFFSDSHTLTSPSPGPAGVGSPGASVGSGMKISTAYFRLFTTTVPLGSRPPVTADTGDLLEWKFDGNLLDSSGHGYTAKMSDGDPSYVPTPGQNLVVAILKTANAPPWSPWISMRVGYANQLDCSASYSQADASAAVVCSWNLASGPSAPTWSSQTSAQPFLNNIQFGTYNFQLTVKDATGNTATSTLAIGAVAYDDNGVVIPSDPRVTQIFGPMIAFGQNPWGYADERAKRAVELQSIYYKTAWPTPTWLTTGLGTVSYPFAGIGPYPGQTGTTLSADIAPTDTSLTIADASALAGLASLPTWILIGNTIGAQEMVRVVATTATSGPATLTVGYDGRGMSSNSSGNAGVVPAQAWSAGTTVGEMRIQGTGTLFGSDPNRPLCPAGLPGPIGPVIYSTGTVSLSPGSNVITGNGTSWNDSHGTGTNAVFITDNTGAAGSTYFIRIDATHGGGSPFVWWAQITSVGGMNQITASRNLPGDIDAGPFPYKITGPRYLSVEFLPSDGTPQRMLQNGMGCESETAAFSVPARDVPDFDLTTQTGVHYSYKDSLGAQSAFGPNFYGSGLASRAFYLRSGWDFANETANTIDDSWIRDPEICGGWGCNASPLLIGGGIVGAFANLVLNPSAKITWPDVRRWAFLGSIGARGCSASDTRDSGYLQGWLTLAALFDPDGDQRANWKQALSAVDARDSRCKQTDNSWANGFLFNPAGPALTLTNGSAIVTGQGLPSSLCHGIASGTVTVINGSAFFVGTGLVNGNKITIGATLGGAPYNGVFQFTQTGGLIGTLAVLWPGDTGTFPFTIENSDYLTTIGSDNDDPQLKKNWACTWNSPTQLTLNQPWDGPNVSNDYLFSYVLAGYGQQPFMLGIKTTVLRWASQHEDADLATHFGAFASLAASWIHDVGYDPNTQGMHYGRIYGACEPLTTSPPGSDFATRTPGCNQGLDPGGIRASRVLTGETSQAIRVYYEANPSVERKIWGDLVYGSIWGYCPYRAPGFYCDDNYVRDENSDSALGSYKWPGYFFGMGMAHQWPAVRLQSGH